MKKFFVVFIGIIFMANICFAMGEIERHRFFNRFDPTSGSFVYYDVNGDSETSEETATGDQVAVNTYKQKTIQVSGIEVGEYISIRIEGRSKDQTNTPNWAVLDTIEFGVASADTDKNKVVDVTEYVDFLRIGIKRFEANATSHIDIEGIFTTLER